MKKGKFFNVKDAVILAASSGDYSIFPGPQDSEVCFRLSRCRADAGFFSEQCFDDLKYIGIDESHIARDTNIS